MTQSQNFALSLEAIGPTQAHTLTLELQTALEGTGTHAVLRMTSALAAAIVLRETVVFQGLLAFLEARGHGELRHQATQVAAAFAHPSDEGARDALTRLVTSALERGLRMAPSARESRVDPLLHSCTEIVELVNAICTWRFGLLPEDEGALAQTPPPGSAEMSAPISNPDGERRRLTRDFEVTPPSARPEVKNTEVPRSGERPSPGRSTLRPSPARSTLRPTSLSQADLDKDAVLVPRTQVRDAQGRPLKKKW